MVASQLLIIVYLAPFSSPKRGKETDAMVRCFVYWFLLCNGILLQLRRSGILVARGEMKWNSGYLIVIA